MKVKAPDPHLRDPEVGPGEGVDGIYPQHDTATMVAQQESRGPDPRAPAAEDPTVNPGKSFPGQFAGKRRKEGFFGH